MDAETVPWACADETCYRRTCTPSVRSGRSRVTAPKGEQPNLLGGDTSFEELRCSAYATARAGSDPRAVDARAREFVEAKTGDIEVHPSRFPNTN